MIFFIKPHRNAFLTDGKQIPHLGTKFLVLLVARFAIALAFPRGSLFSSSVSSPACRIMYSLSRWNVSTFAISVKLMLHGVQNEYTGLQCSSKRPPLL